MQNPEKTTRLVLKFNAAFSSLVGIDLILFNSTWMKWMNITNEIILPIIGLGLIPFGIYVFWVAFKKPLSLKELRSIVIMDLGWVLGCILLTASNIFGLSMLGNGLVLISALIVGTFAFFQHRGWKAVSSLQ
jgi:hypothetical protein